MAATSTLMAQERYPARTLRLVVGYPPGGGSDFVARTLGLPMSTTLGQTIVVENKAGAATTLAAMNVKNSIADGYTILLADLSTLVFNPLLYRNLSYMPQDFAPVGFTVRFEYCLVANPNAPFNTVPEVIKFARERTDTASYASAGVGSTHHLMMEMFSQEAGIRLMHVPYKGAAPAMQDVMAGLVPLMFADTASALPLIQAGKLRPIAVASDLRLPKLPDVPTFKEEGFPDVYANSWGAMVMPKDTPQDRILTLNKALNAALSNKEASQKLNSFGAVPVVSSPSDLAQAITDDTKRWSNVIGKLDLSLTL